MSHINLLKKSTQSCRHIPHRGILHQQRGAKFTSKQVGGYYGIFFSQKTPQSSVFLRQKVNNFKLVFAAERLRSVARCCRAFLLYCPPRVQQFKHKLSQEAECLPCRICDPITLPSQWFLTLFLKSSQAPTDNVIFDKQHHCLSFTCLLCYFWVNSGLIIVSHWIADKCPNLFPNRGLRFFPSWYWDFWSYAKISGLPTVNCSWDNGWRR